MFTIVEIDLKIPDNKDTANVVLVQTCACPADPEEKVHHIKKIRQLLKNALDKKPNFIVFPEFTIPWELCTKFQNIARSKKVYIIGGLAPYSNDDYNCAKVFSPYEVDTLIQHKIKIPPIEQKAAKDKNISIQSGKEIYVYKNTGFGSFAIPICYDFENDEMLTALKSYDVNILFVVSWNQDVKRYRTLAIQKAIDMYAYICLCNTSGQGFGFSGVYGPVKKRRDKSVIGELAIETENLLELELNTSKLLESIENVIKNAPVNEGFSEPPSYFRETTFKMRRNVKKNITELRQRKPRILVIGDVMLDHVIYGGKAKFKDVRNHRLRDFIYVQESIAGDCRGVRPKGCRPEMFSPGGAAWLAYSLASVAQVRLMGLIGSNKSVPQKAYTFGVPDYEAQKLIETLSNKVEFIPIMTRTSPTISKNYFFYRHSDTGGEGGYQVLRVDREDSQTMQDEVTNSENGEPSLEEIIIKNLLSELVILPDAIVIDDHEKGMITPKVIEVIKEKAKNVKLFVRPGSKWDKFKNIHVTAILANMKEFFSEFNLSVEEILTEIDNMSVEEVRQYMKQNNLSDYLAALAQNYNFDEFILRMDSYGFLMVNKTEEKELESYFINPFKPKHSFITGVGSGGVFASYYIASKLSDKAPLESTVLGSFSSGLKTRRPLGTAILLEDIYTKLSEYQTYFGDYEKL